MGNGQSTPYELSTGEWMETTTAIELINDSLKRRELVDIELAKTLSEINESLRAFPCAVHANKIETLQARPSATKAIYIVGGLVSLILGVYAFASVM